MNVRVDMSTPIYDGTEVVFRSPVDCSQVTGLIVYYPENDTTVSKEFAFADAHGNNVGDIDHLFAENVVVKVILDLETSMAFVQNADTNAYLEGRFKELEDKIGTGGGTSGSKQLVVTITRTEDGKMVSSHTSTKIHDHIEKGGSAIAWFSESNDYVSLDDIEAGEVSLYLHGDSGFLSIYRIDDDGNVSGKQVTYATKSDIGDISAALDAIIAIQNELMGGDGV